MITYRDIRVIRFWMVALALLLSATPAMAQIVKIESPADGTVSYRDRIAVITRGQPGFPMTLHVNGDAVQTLTVRPDMKADFLNVTVPVGPGILSVAQLFPGGRTFTDSVTIHVVGAAARVVLDVQPTTIPADSLSQAELIVHVVDEWGMPLADGQIVTVQLDHGTLLTPDIYPDQPGTQVQVRNGVAVSHIRSPIAMNTGHIRVTVDGITAETELGYTLPHERWTMVGTATGQIGMASATR